MNMEQKKQEFMKKFTRNLFYRGEPTTGYVWKGFGDGEPEDVWQWIEELVREEREKAIAECGISQDKVNLGSADNMEKEEAIKIRRELLAKMPIVLPYY